MSGSGPATSHKVDPPAEVGLLASRTSIVYIYALFLLFQRLLVKKKTKITAVKSYIKMGTASTSTCVVYYTKDYNYTVYCSGIVK